VPEQFLLSGTTSFADPGSWNPASNTIDCIGSGGAASGRQSASIGGVGGGGGAFARVTNQSPTFPVTVAIPAAGAQSTCSFGSVCIADYGRTGTTATAGAGGLTANSTGSTLNAGGSGRRPTTGNNGGGGGGAGGPSGAGASATTNIGGAGDGGNTAAPAANADGNDGTQYDATHGSGSGGSGRSGSNGNGRAGGSYGGGGGGSYTQAANAGGAGSPGLIRINWTGLHQGASTPSASATVTADPLGYTPGTFYDNLSTSTTRSDALAGVTIAASFTASATKDLLRLHLRLSR
jgi:hypothetical protein